MIIMFTFATRKVKSVYLFIRTLTIFAPISTIYASNADYVYNSHKFSTTWRFCSDKFILFYCFCWFVCFYQSLTLHVFHLLLFMWSGFFFQHLSFDNHQIYRNIVFTNSKQTHNAMPESVQFPCVNLCSTRKFDENIFLSHINSFWWFCLFCFRLLLFLYSSCVKCFPLGVWLIESINKNYSQYYDLFTICSLWTLFFVFLHSARPKLRHDTYTFARAFEFSSCENQFDDAEGTHGIFWNQQRNMAPSFKYSNAITALTKPFYKLMQRDWKWLVEVDSLILT